jgi:hypothetical protein
MGLRTGTPSTRDRPPRRAGVVQRYLSTDAAIGVAAVTAGIIGLIAMPTGPDTVGRLTIDNPSVYDVQVALAHNGSELPIGTVEEHRTEDFTDVIDQGGTWTFVFRAQGRDAGQVKVNRSDLSSHDWHLTIPSSASTRLQNEGAPASPCATASCASHS